MKITGFSCSLAVALVFFTGTLYAAKPDPTICPCFPVMVDLVAQSSCTIGWDQTRLGKGKDGWTKTLIWVEGDSCSQIRVSAAGRLVDVYEGDESGLSTCVVTGDRCLMSELSGAEIKACDRVLRAAKREVQKLPNCP